MYIRFSRETDKDEIRELLGTSFGSREHLGVLENLNGRYLLAFEDDELVAMTGLMWESEYNAYDVDWTCTHPDYRKRGIMHELFKRICSLTDEKIYCSCWRIGDNEHVNLHSLMNDFGFKEVIKNRGTWDSRYNCESARKHCCIMQKCQRNHGVLVPVPCRCYEDLYLREAITDEHNDN